MAGFGPLLQQVFLFKYTNNWFMWGRNGSTICVLAERKSSGMSRWHPPSASLLVQGCVLTLLIPLSQVGLNCLNYWSLLPQLIFLLLLLYFFFPAWRELKRSFELLCQQICSKTCSKRLLMSSWGSDSFPGTGCSWRAYPCISLRHLKRLRIIPAFKSRGKWLQVLQCLNSLGSFSLRGAHARH